MTHVTDYEKYRREDEKIINPDTLRCYCCTNEPLIAGAVAVRALVLEFPGLGGGSCLGGSMDNLTVYDTPFTRDCAEKGIVVAYAFPGPWSWMNKGAVRVVDLVVDAFMRKYGWVTEDDFRLVVMGGSMGGQSALVYSMDSRHRVNACVAHCPCYDVVDCFDEIDSFPRTFVSAVNAYDMPLEEAIRRISPSCRVDELPDIPYLITADELDEIIPVEGLEQYVERVKQAGRSVTYMRLDGQPHGGITAEDRERMNEFVFSAAAGRGA
jgi:pimeloyl-ACP methyl ester carboxylesterase